MDGSFRESEWKDQDRSGKDSTAQGHLPLICKVPRMGLADAQFIEACSCEGALRYAVQRSGEDDFEVADKIGISHSYFSKVLKGTAGLYGKRLVRFMRETRNLAPLQWYAAQMGCDVVQRSSQAAHIAKLEAELQAARRGERMAA